MHPTTPCGLYVHVPFCSSRCTYCAFVSESFEETKAEAYVQALIHEVNLWGAGGGSEISAAGIPFDTLYLGGGTPSLLAASQIERLLGACFQRFVWHGSPEITIEVNPGSCSRQWLKDMLSLGINRMSLGAQSFNDQELRKLGRPHDARAILRTFDDMRAVGVCNISLDLIAGFPGHSISGFEQSLQTALFLAPEHMSMYLFELKEGSPINNLIAHGREQPPDEDLAADLYLLCCDFLARHGYVQYEISNFSREGYECRHNMKYWRDDDYLGVGAGAHGLIRDRRYWNMGDVEAYLNCLTEGALPLEHVYRMQGQDRFREAMIMGARLVKGLDLGFLGGKYHVDAHAFVSETLCDLEGLGLFEIDGDVFRLTEKGRMLSNQIFCRWV